MFFDIGEIVDHHCLGVIIRFVDIGGSVEPHCLEVIVCFAYHIYLEVIVRFVDIGGIHGENHRQFACGSNFSC